MQVVKLLLFALFGLLIARLTGLSGLEDAGWYNVAVSALLAIGLYASTYGIVHSEARQHLRLIIGAVTIGVICKAALVGVVLAFLFQDPFFIILGITVAQIDPLSVASLIQGERMSPKAKAILASWASFDDPITVVLSLYAPLIAMHVAGLPAVHDTGGSLADYALTFSYNLLFAGAVFGLWRLLRRSRAAQIVLLAVALLLAIWQFWMLGIALIGLFLRPAQVERYTGKAITIALSMATILLGLLLVNGVDLVKGAALGAAAYIAQMAVGYVLTRRLPVRDRWHISFAQQNGITTIVLALLFEPVHPGTVAIVAPAIITINTLHAIVNALIDKFVTSKIPPRS